MEYYTAMITNDKWNNMKESHIELSKRSKPDSKKCVLQYYSYENQKQAKLIYDFKTHNSDYIWRGEWA